MTSVGCPIPRHRENRDHVTSEDDRSVEELFAELPEKRQQAMAEVGLGLPELLRMAAAPDGLRKVRRILTDVSTSPRPSRPGEGKRPAIWPWGRLLLATVASALVSLLLSLFIGTASAYVGIGLGLLVIWLAFKTPDSRGAPAARFLTAATYFVLIFTGSHSVNAWYLQLRGEEQTVTLASPTHQWTHGTRETYCRVRLQDGSVHEVIDNKDECADRVGQRTTAVVDPSGHYDPSLGTKSDLGGVVEGYVCLGAAVVLVLTPVIAVTAGRRDGNRAPRTVA
jgi:hypothetical protein